MVEVCIHAPSSPVGFGGGVKDSKLGSAEPTECQCWACTAFATLLCLLPRTLG